MKKIILVLAAFALLSSTFIDFYEEIEITKEKAKEYLLQSIASAVLQADGDVVSKTKNLPVELRVQGIKQLIQLAKEYTASEEFKADYKKYRHAKLNPDEKTRLGVPKFGKMINNKIDNAVDKGKNEKLYPSDPSEMVKQRLQDFLVVSKTVDFDAEVQNKKFVRPDYERKSAQWKMCYRAGKEVVEAAQTEAIKWLQELE